MNVTGYIECLSTAVADGAALLDEYDPGWWRVDRQNLINLGQLDMYSTGNCLLGQMFGDYTIGRRALGIAEGEGDLYGLDSYQENWDMLDSMWYDLITARRATAA